MYRLKCKAESVAMLKRKGMGNVRKAKKVLTVDV